MTPGVVALGVVVSVQGGGDLAKTSTGMFTKGEGSEPKRPSTMAET